MRLNCLCTRLLRWRVRGIKWCWVRFDIDLPQSSQAVGLGGIRMFAIIVKIVVECNYEINRDDQPLQV